MHGLLLTDIPDPDLLITRGGDKHASRGVPGQALHDITVLEGQRSLTGADIPQLDSEVTRGRSQDVLGGRVEEDLSNFPAAPVNIYAARIVELNALP